MKTVGDARALAETLVELGPARRPRGGLPAHRHGSAARPRRRQRARDPRGEGDARGRGAARLHRARAERRRRLLSLSDLGIDQAEGRALAEQAIADGSAVAAYERWIRAQGGDPDESLLPVAPVVVPVAAPADGYVSRIAAIQVGRAALHLGAGRAAAGDAIDHAVGVMCLRKRGDEVVAGDRSPRSTPRTRRAPRPPSTRCSRRTRSRIRRRRGARSSSRRSADRGTVPARPTGQQRLRTVPRARLG